MNAPHSEPRARFNRRAFLLLIGFLVGALFTLKRMAAGDTLNSPVSARKQQTAMIAFPAIRPRNSSASPSPLFHSLAAKTHSSDRGSTMPPPAALSPAATITVSPPSSGTASARAVTTASSPLVRYSRPTAGMCHLHGQPYECAAMLDWSFYTRMHSDLADMDEARAREHWMAYGFREARRGHPGHRVLKAVIMSKDDWPLLRASVLYHAHLLGGPNVYVLDGSSNPDAVAFLKDATAVLGVNTLFTPANLNTIGDEVNQLLRSLRWSADYVIKLDTDEFLVLRVDPATGAPLSVSGIREYIDTLPRDGSKLRSGSWALSLPPENCTADDDPVTAEDFFFYETEVQKQFTTGPTFSSVDLGAHTAQVLPPADNSVVHHTHLVVAHYTLQCVERYIANCKRAVVSHGYFTPDGSQEEHKKRCREYDATSLPGVSSHKVRAYCDYLYDQKRWTQHYQETHVGIRAGSHPFRFHPLAALATELAANFSGMLGGGGAAAAVPSLK